MATETDIRTLLARLAGTREWNPPPGAHEEHLLALSRQFACGIPESLRQWWRTCNGPIVGAGWLFGVATPNRFADIVFLCTSFPEWRERGWLPLGNDGCGNYYVLDPDPGDGEHYPVFFVDHEIDMGSPAYLVASGVWEFLWFYLSEELGERRWPFDRDFVLAHDPEIIRFRDYAPLPWEVDEEP